MWDVYRQVEGAHQPAAWKAAANRWPDDARATFPDYPSGRLICRPEGDTRGMPVKIIAPIEAREAREARFNAGERVCIGCGARTPDTYGGLCATCDQAAAEEEGAT